MPPVASPKSSAIVVPHPAKWHGKLAAALIYATARSLAATLRFTWRDDSGLFSGDKPEPVIFCIWHNRLALSLILYTGYVQRRQPTRRMAALVSASKDGGMLARALEHFGVEPVRGSSSRRGAQALLELTSCAGRGLDLAITPDGPRGPCYAVQEGILSLAQLTGHPIVPVSYHLGWKKTLRSWDHFQIPLPFARCEARFGQPLRVPRESTDAGREQLRLELERRMMEITLD